MRRNLALALFMLVACLPSAGATTLPPPGNLPVRERLCELNLLAQAHGLAPLTEADLRASLSSHYRWQDRPVRRRIAEFLGGETREALESLVFSIPFPRISFKVRYPGGLPAELILHDRQGPRIYTPASACPAGEECGEASLFSPASGHPALPASYRAHRTKIEVPAEIWPSVALELNARHPLHLFTFRVELLVNHQNLTALLTYFQPGQEPSVLAERVERAFAAKGEDETYLPLELFLPPFPRRSAHSFAPAELCEGRLAPNCANTAASYFRAEALVYSRNNNSSERLHHLVGASYEELPPDTEEASLRSGDILEYRGPLWHAARVLFRGQDGVVWVFHKAHMYNTSPYQVLPLSAAFQPFLRGVDLHHPLPHLHVYRRVR